MLDSAAAIYTGLTWRKEADDLAVLRGATDDHHDGADTCDPGVAEAGPDRVLDPDVGAGVPAGSRIVSYPRPTGPTMAARSSSASGAGTRRSTGKARRTETKVRKLARSRMTRTRAKEPDEPAAVEVWHARDIDVMPRQKINARNDRQRNTLAAWHVDTDRFVPLGTDLHERVVPIRRQRLAYAVNWAPYAMERTIGRPSADVYLVDIESRRAHEGQRRHRRPVPAGQPRRPVPALHAGRSVLDD